MELTEVQKAIIEHAREALASDIKECCWAWQNRADHTEEQLLAAIAVASLFADLVTGEPACGEIIEAINQQLRSAGFELVPRR